MLSRDQKRTLKKKDRSGSKTRQRKRFRGLSDDSSDSSENKTKSEIPSKILSVSSKIQPSELKKESPKYDEFKEKNISEQELTIEKNNNINTYKNKEISSPKEKNHLSFSDILNNIDSYATKQKNITKFKIPKKSNIPLNERPTSSEKARSSVDEKTSGKFLINKHRKESKTRTEKTELKLKYSGLNNVCKWQPYVSLSRNIKIERMALKLRRQQRLLREKIKSEQTPSIKCTINLDVLQEVVHL